MFHRFLNTKEIPHIIDREHCAILQVGSSPVALDKAAPAIQKALGQ